MLLGLSEALPSLVEAKFKAAKASQALIFNSTELAIIRTSAGVPFQLRYCPALAKKPGPRNYETPKRVFKPFENPQRDQPELFLSDVPTTNPSHLLMLNKFPIIPNHSILATKEYKKQTHILEEDDLGVSYACLKAWEEGQGNGQRRLFAFYNSGEHSGASQPHRHVQFLPVESVHQGEASAEWDLLIDSILASGVREAEDPSSEPLQHPTLPFVHFAYNFGLNPSASGIYQVYLKLLQLAKEAVRSFIASNPGQLTLHPDADGDVPISYNLAMTTSGMAILPRRSEGHVLRRDDGTIIGSVQLNGTTLGGTLMVKYQEEWDLIKVRPDKLDAILEAVGIPRTT